MLQPEQSRRRQRRLLAVMAERGLDAVVLGARHHVYWATAYRPRWLQEAAVVLHADGRAWLATANEPATNVAADSVVAFAASIVATQRLDQSMVLAEMALGTLAVAGAKRIGVDASTVSAGIAMSFGGDAVAIDPSLWQLRRPKDPDELDLMKKAIACTQAMYVRARQIIEPGVAELHVFNEMHAAAVEAAGEPLGDHLGNDFAAGVAGGPPRAGKLAEAGQLYILDLSPNYRGYFADNARVFAVDRSLTDEQLRAWQAIVDVLNMVERMARPGVRCRELFAAADEHLKQTLGVPMAHHLGHGVGLQPHEFPHLNPKHWDDVLVEGEVFTAEPGVYSDALNGGIRLENQYVVTADGVENLVKAPLEMA
jgi:Xaa-Pro dipeptidase